VQEECPPARASRADAIDLDAIALGVDESGPVDDRAPVHPDPPGCHEAARLGPGRDAELGKGTDERHPRRWPAGTGRTA
jgi:hypothetical protein